MALAGRPSTEEVARREKWLKAQIKAGRVAPVRKLTLDEALEQAELAAKLRKENRLAFFRPYPKQLRFIALTKIKKEVGLIAANQFGKSETGSHVVASWMTGQYAKGWEGRRWSRPTRGWIAGETSLVVRDVQQRKLCGEPGVESAFGTGMIPKDSFVDKPSLARGVTDAYDTIQVKYLEPDGTWRGGVSVARFKSYEQGRAKFQGVTLYWGWGDEEPPEDIYSEFLTRIAEGGCLMMTFTPLRGRSKVVLRFIDEPSVDRAFVNATLDEAEHFSEEERKRRMEGYLAHERDARSKGIPILGSGAVYGFSQDMIREAPIEHLPVEWAKLWGIDFGIDHPFAACLIAWDKDIDCIHVLQTIRMSGIGNTVLPINHAAAMRAIAAAVPVAWPHDGHVRDKGSGEELAVLYRKHGLAMLADHATFDTGGYSREAAVMEVAERAMSGRFKVASHLSDFWSEWGLYHRKDGQIVKQEDDIMSALEKAVMMKRHARPGPLGSKVAKRRIGLVAAGVDDDHWGI